MVADGNSAGWAAELGAAVRRQRRSLGMTQLEVSTLAGCGPVFVYDVERGKPGLRLDKLVDLLQVLGLQFALQPGKQGLRVDEALR
jgi:y4mF family transcriptional regulator